MRKRTLVALILPAAALSLPAPIEAERSSLPLDRLTLYRSGVGYFEHAGTVEGDETVRLRFEADRVNDVLKSLVPLDLDGGRIAGVVYEPKQRLERRMKDFPIQLQGATPLFQIFRQAQGSEVRLRTTEGEIEGTILSVEKRPTPMGGGDKPQIVQDWFINLVTDHGVQAVAQRDIRSFELLDEDLAESLRRALTAVDEHRAERWTSLDLRFEGEGEGERRAAVAYTHEAPVWKTSYRLVLPESPGGEINLHGWAIVENDTGRDWESVQVSLASGRPISFVMDLQTPLILDRPQTPVPLLGSIGPTMYESGRELAAQKTADFGEAESRTEQFEQANDYRRSRRQARENTASARPNIQQHAAAAQAAGADVGEQFFYTVESPVSLEQGRSITLPILNTPVEARRVSIYSPNGNNNRPMRGVELTNDTGLHLMPGPIAVFDGGAYAGDAQIMHVARGQKRLLSYAVDHDLEASRDAKTERDVANIRIVDGMIEQTRVRRREAEYVFKNNDQDRSRIALIEHAKRSGWDLVQPQEPAETTDSLYRFEVAVEPDAGASLTVALERTESHRLAVTDMDLDMLIARAEDGKASQQVVDAVKKAASIQHRINAYKRRVESLDEQRRRIESDQNRIRSNMREVSRNSDIYARYVKKLAEQEDRLEQIASQRENTQQKLNTARDELRDFLNGLNIS